MKAKKWFKITAKADDAAEISIFGDIGESFWFESVTVADFKKQFDAIKDTASIKLLLNSPGGSVMDAMAIYNILSGVREKLTVEVLGMAASAASIVALSGAQLIMGEGTFFMIHNPWGLAQGDAEELRKTADILDTIAGQMADIYVEHSALDLEEVTAAMGFETWYTADDAVAAGFADSIADYGDIAASVSGLNLGKYRYAHVPADIRAAARDEQLPETKREFEQFLRDAGFSKNQARDLARGFRDTEERRDAVSEERRDAVVEEKPKVLKIDEIRMRERNKINRRHVV